MAVASVDFPAPINPEMLMKIGYVGMCLKHAGVGDAFLRSWLLLSSTGCLSAIWSGARVHELVFQRDPQNPGEKHSRQI